MPRSILKQKGWICNKVHTGQRLCSSKTKKRWWAAQWANPKIVCSEMGMSIEHQIHKMKRIDGEELANAVIEFEAELRQEML